MLSKCTCTVPLAQQLPYPAIASLTSSVVLVFEMIGLRYRVRGLDPNTVCGDSPKSDGVLS